MSSCMVKKDSEGSSIHIFKTICVFDGSNIGKNGEFVKATNKLGKILVAKKINLVYGGGSLELKRCVASSTFMGESKVLGILLKHLRNITRYTLGGELKVSSMYERMSYML